MKEFHRHINFWSGQSGKRPWIGVVSDAVQLPLNFWPKQPEGEVYPDMVPDCSREEYLAIYQGEQTGDHIGSGCVTRAILLCRLLLKMKALHWRN